ncbi:hypothetical protein A3E49_00940 [Candidatus Saccharibacteria bacterium RIFCSPHIGHO2_12_FULL_49_19]|nr:MAG: hypothetical protein A2708_01420 [Candidatus Saccharibacteria bacterium RIFCSPHIGHO2_01_FULL_49_21]OGL36714.1 MAG: hypothetical protein A3E49_00940 [Candidatus Saccharibacteria bacterium RIFCSPHIGHO2_12_FULL_49_19]OGL37980.1 MAG: hypothetical protein A3B63_01500 [Candidatus Saccharibacteria bacterium RIFCSPLOWO2_01_FULL_49_22]
MKPLEILGLDVGKSHTGIARGNMLAKIAEPLSTVKTDEVFGTLDKMIDQLGINTVVVGLPRSLDGRDTEQTVWTRQWAAKAKHKLGIPIYWQDEALTTKKAISHQPSANSSIDEHALAAVAILQDFLDSPENMRVSV